MNIFSRRKFIRLFSLSPLLLTNGCCDTPPPSTDSQQQHLLLNVNDLRYRWLLSAARAPSAHNMQPWQVWLTDDKQHLIIYLDPRRLLAKTDPDQRQSLLSLGAFIELLVMAAQTDGYQTEVSLFPQGEDLDAAIAECHFVKSADPIAIDPLSHFIYQRQTYRQAFDLQQHVTQTVLQSLIDSGNSYGINSYGSIDPLLSQRLKQRTIAASYSEFTNQAIMLETLLVSRIGLCEIEQWRDGIAIPGLIPHLASLIGLFPRDKAPEPGSITMKKMQTMVQEQANSAQGWLWLTTTGNSRQQQVAAGRAFVRLHLRAASLNIALQPMSQALESYPTMSKHYTGLYQDLTLDRQQQTIQILARIGYACESQPLSLRRYVQDFIKE